MVPNKVKVCLYLNLHKFHPLGHPIDWYLFGPFLPRYRAASRRKIRRIWGGVGGGAGLGPGQPPLAARRMMYNMAERFISREWQVNMNKREFVLNLVHGETPPDPIPAAFFMHFDGAHHQGQAAIDKHLEFFRFTGMDFVKIQCEETLPPAASIHKPEEWAHVLLRGTIHKTWTGQPC